MNNNIKFLGSGCWQGIPGQFCDDSISRNVEWDTKDFRFRTSLHIKTKNNKEIIVEITPDIRLQSWKFKLRSPDAFLISHWHWDHLFGLKDLDWYCEKNIPLVYGNKETKKWYDSDMSYIPINFREFNSYEPFTIDNLKITPFEVIHVEGTDGFLFEDMETKKKIVYLSDLCGLPEKSYKLIKGVDIIIVDATYLDSKRIDDDPTHFSSEGLLNFIRELDSKEIILTNIGSYNNLTHNELQEKYTRYTIAYDGLKKEF